MHLAWLEKFFSTNARVLLNKPPTWLEKSTSDVCPMHGRMVVGAMCGQRAARFSHLGALKCTTTTESGGCGWGTDHTDTELERLLVRGRGGATYRFSVTAHYAFTHFCNASKLRMRFKPHAASPPSAA